MYVTSNDIGKIIKDTRKQLKITQRELALVSDTGERFIIELEKGKETCQLGKVINVIQALGIKFDLQPPDFTSL